MTEPYILVIDDDETLLATVDSILKKNGYNSALAKDAKEGFILIEKRLPQLILLDIKLPEMDGYEVLDKLKGDEKTKDIPVIMLTSKNNIASVSQCLENGAHDYIVKPFDYNNLIARVKQVIEDA
jgi:DNA-binding response OmpR family regulator